MNNPHVSRAYPIRPSVESALINFRRHGPATDVPLVEEYVRKQGGLSECRLVKVLNTFVRIYRLCPGFSVAAAGEDELLKLGECIRGSVFSAHTKRDAFVILRRYYKVMEGRSAHYPVKLDFFKPPGKPGPVKGPSDVISRRELESMLNSSKTDRDKAIIMLLYEGGLRVGELCALDVKDVRVVDDGVDLHVPDKPDCKTGVRDIWLTECVGRVQDYLATYEFRDEPDKPFFVQVDKEAMNAFSVRRMLRRLAERVGVQPGRVHPHAWRHTCATEKAVIGFSESQLNAFMGWKQGGDTSGYYVHMSKRGVKDAYRRALGFPTDGEQRAVKRCPKCGYENSFFLGRCARCYTPLDIKRRMEDMGEREKRYRRLQEVEARLEKVGV